MYICARLFGYCARPSKEGVRLSLVAAAGLGVPSPLRRALVTLYRTVREEATPQQRHLETLTVGCHILQYC